MIGTRAGGITTTGGITVICGTATGNQAGGVAGGVAVVTGSIGSMTTGDIGGVMIGNMSGLLTRPKLMAVMGNMRMMDNLGGIMGLMTKPKLMAVIGNMRMMDSLGSLVMGLMIGNMGMMYNLGSLVMGLVIGNMRMMYNMGSLVMALMGNLDMIHMMDHIPRPTTIAFCMPCARSKTIRWPPFLTTVRLWRT